MLLRSDRDNAIQIKINTKRKKKAKKDKVLLAKMNHKVEKHFKIQDIKIIFFTDTASSMNITL